MIILSQTEKQDLELQHKRERDSRICDRIKAVLLSSEGWSQIHISQALRIRSETVRDHLRDFEKSKKLKPNNGGSIGALSKDQTDQLIQHLENKTYVQAFDICKYVFDNFSVAYTISGLTKWLHCKGFSYKKPKLTPSKADPEKQEAFIQKYLELLDTKADNDPVLFIDSVHPTMATKVTHGWIKTGTDKLIAATASRTRVNLTGSINLDDMNVTTQTYETINGKTTIDFLKSLEATYHQAFKIHVILDQSGYHTCAEVLDFIKTSRIELHYLPPYSPNLNPIERLWKVMNEQVRDNRVFHSVKEFRKAIADFFAGTWPQISNLMVNRVNDNFQILKQASSS
jgi:transposase